MRFLNLFIFTSIILAAHPVFAARTISLAPASDSSNLLEAESQAFDGSQLRLQMGGAASGLNNVDSIWHITDDGRPVREFSDDSAYALLQMSSWVRLTHGQWWFGFGSARRDAYEGNSDAAQLWMDLHSDVQTQTTYLPVISNVSVDISWQAIGRRFPFKMGRINGTGSVSLKRICAEDYLSRSAIGHVEGDSFSGMIRIVSADTNTGAIEGQGWSLDAEAWFRIGTRWVGQAAIEGLIGRLNWHELVVQDGYITSPGVFVDPDGFLRDCGGMTGAEWHADMSCRLNPYFRLDLMMKGRPGVLLGLISQAGERTVPSMGLAWSSGNGRLVHLRFFPTEDRLEVGAAGSGWQIRISGDDWLFTSPKHAEISLWASPFQF